MVRQSTHRRRCPTARASKVSPVCDRLLVSHKEEFARTLTAKLLAYAIGRGVEYYDLPAIRHDRAGCGGRWIPLVVDRRGYRQEPGVQHEQCSASAVHCVWPRNRT